MANFLTFNGINSADFGVQISGSGVFMKPKRKVKKFSVPGRSGDLTIDEGEYENVSVVYPAFIIRGFEHKFHDFIDAMLSVEGYGRLEDTYQDRHYRMGMFVEPPEPDVGVLNRCGKFDLEFDCMPQRWLKNGEVSKIVSIASSTTRIIISNPTNHIAKPLLYLNEKGEQLNITSGGKTYTVTFSNTSSLNGVWIDCDAEECYNGSTPANSDVVLDWNVGFPKFHLGDTVFSCNTPFSFTYIPRWWDL